MVELYCDACGNRMYERYIKAKVDIGKAKGVEVHAYVNSKHDICNDCIVDAVRKAGPR